MEVHHYKDKFYLTLRDKPPLNGAFFATDTSQTDLNAGHGGASGRFAGLQDAAYKLALLFDLYAVEEGVK